MGTKVPGGALFDIYLSYALSFTLAGVAGLLNLIAIGAMMVLRRTARHPPQGSPAIAAT
jgi:hypothetical protein